MSHPLEMPDVRHRAAVLGSPIEHSRSPILHNAGYEALGMDDWEYTRIECTAEELPAVVGGAGEEFAGFSVTMPAKFAALDFADEATDRARQIGSANTLLRTESGWRADNTDCDGITGALEELLGGRFGQARRALVVGGGGTARPALWALAQAGVTDITVINRSDRGAELAPLLHPLGVAFRFAGFDSDLAAAARQADVIVSTVPSVAVEGREQDLAHAPILDVIYEPRPTPLTVAAAANGYLTVDGHVMLAHQAYGQFEQFTGRPAPREAMGRALGASLG